MRQVILVLLHRDFDHAKKLLEYFRGECDIFVHIDKGTLLTRADIDYLRNMPGVVAVYSKYYVHWAGFSILKAELFLLKQALAKSSGSYFHLISGQDYPLKPLREFLAFFSHTKAMGYVGCKHLPTPSQDNNTYYRLQHYVLSDYLPTKTAEGKRKVWSFVDWQRRHGIKRRIPDYFGHLYGGSAWFSISRDVAKFLVGYTRSHPAFYRRMRFTYIPEEIYVPTVMLNSPFAQSVESNNNCRTILWDNEGVDCSPIYVTSDRVCDLLSNPLGFFSRKFDSIISEDAIKIIDKYLLVPKEWHKMDNGGWDNDSNLYAYDYDEWLAGGIADFCRTFDVKTVCDFGCGPGWYVAKLRARGLKAVGYDANPHTTELANLTNGTRRNCPCGIADLTEDMYSHRFDMVISLGVGAYIPAEYERNFVANLKRNGSKYIVIAWQGSNKDYAVNRHTNKEVVDIFTLDCCFLHNEVATKWLRNSCRLSLYQNSLFVFQRC